LRLAPRRTRAVAAALAATALAMAGAVLANAWYEARRAPLLAFARQVAPHVPAGTAIGVRGGGAESDGIGLGYLLGRSLARVRGHIVRSGIVIVPRAQVETAAIGCRRLVQADGEAGLALVSCEPA